MFNWQNDSDDLIGKMPLSERRQMFGLERTSICVSFVTSLEFETGRRGEVHVLSV